MVKLLGAAIILMAATLIGFAKAAQYSARPRQLREWISILQRLETEIVYAVTPLPEALSTIAGHTPEPLGLLLKQLADRLERPQGDAAALVWRDVLRRAWPGTALKQGELDILLRLGSTLGLTDREDQVKHVRLAIGRLQAEEAAAREEERRYERMWKSLGALIGALVVVLMY
ncbi:stage III sporulation protein SpoIIIAB [Paenibacillus sp. y28]|uniref:stage III sporulation protein SpoIIIAB n=1 Tax=Paenibacillus sp. y28 TaxID=3129110 RepID=UPI00301B1714